MSTAARRTAFKPERPLRTVSSYPGSAPPERVPDRRLRALICAATSHGQVAHHGRYGATAATGVTLAPGAAAAQTAQ